MKLYKTISSRRLPDGEWIPQYNIEFTEAEYAQCLKDELENNDRRKVQETEFNEKEAQQLINKAAMDFADKLLSSSSDEQESIKSEYQALKQSIIDDKVRKNNAVTERFKSQD